MKEIGVYVHIPFCVKKCKYCDFNSYDNLHFLHLDYLNAILKDIKKNKDGFKEYKVSSIFIGGGTPSVFVSGGIATILNEIKKNYSVLKTCEITIEANPNSITQLKAKEWYDAGVNRVSVGLQSANEKILQMIGRSHTKQDYINAMQILLSTGFENINTDIMYGLPKQTVKNVRATISIAVKMHSKHISAYSLILEQGTQLFDEVQQGIIKLPNEDHAIKMYNFINSKLSYIGYSRYEVSNFALTNYECIHNLNCWNYVNYIGFGAGAHGFIKNKRYQNESDVKKYVNLVNDNKNYQHTETLTKKQMAEEIIMLGLRKIEGVSLLKLKEVGCNILKTKARTIKELKELKLIDYTNTHLFVTQKGMAILNKIILDLVN